MNDTDYNTNHYQTREGDTYIEYRTGNPTDSSIGNRLNQLQQIDIYDLLHQLDSTLPTQPIHTQH